MMKTFMFPSNIYLSWKQSIFVYQYLENKTWLEYDISYKFELQFYVELKNRKCVRYSIWNKKVKKLFFFQTEIVRNWGCTAEEYNVTTDDGYQILIVRFYFNITKSTPILFGHGIYMNSLGFVAKFNKTLGKYVLCVWRKNALDLIPLLLSWTKIQK